MKAGSTIIVGMSGGVDSSLSALLLKEQNYQVQGLFMKNWEEDDTDVYCSARLDYLDAKSVCDKLDIPLLTVNFAKEYWDRVFTHFLTEYEAGRTPNPDILCNREIKFKAFLDYALQLGAEGIATGHYAKKTLHPNLGYQLHMATDLSKDQSYFLYTLNQTILDKTLFPLAGLNKTEVRDLAKKYGLPVYNKKDSTGICFIGERKFKQFLGQYLPAQPGTIETDCGKTIGEHQGLMFYTIGQRQGIGIGGKAQFKNEPWFVIGKDLARNCLIVTQGHDHPLLKCQTLKAKDLSWVQGRPPDSNTGLSFQCKAKIRYRQQAVSCRVDLINVDEAQVTFETPERAVTPGQAVVFYDNDVCLGGGTIQ